MKIYYNFTVKGRGQFPLDMLRYDMCWPQTTQDVSIITGSIGLKDQDIMDQHGPKGGYTVSLQALQPPSIKRWESLGWPAVYRSVSQLAG
jgi:hypothetical protein